jgi:Uma2 family endonuclease
VERGDLGTVLAEPFQIRLGQERRRRMPDAFFIAKDRLDIIHQQEVEGAPDLVMEILSPESRTRDRREKFADYQSAGVREYWIVDPESGKAEVYVLRDGKFTAVIEQEGKIHSSVLPGFFIRTAWLTQVPLPKVHKALQEMDI